MGQPQTVMGETHAQGGVATERESHRSGQLRTPVRETTRVFATHVIGDESDGSSHWGEPSQQLSWRRIATLTIHESFNLTTVGMMVQINNGPLGMDTVGPLASEPKSLNDSTFMLMIFSPNQARPENSPPNMEFWYYNRHSRTTARIEMPPDLHPKTIPIFSPTRPLIAYQVLADEDIQRRSARFIVRRWGSWDLLAQGRPWRRCSDAPVRLEWTANEQSIRWYPPRCELGDPLVDSLLVPLPCYT